MQSLIIAFNAVMPLFIYIGLGHYIRRIQAISEKTLVEMNALTFKFFFPINLMVNVINTELPEHFRYDALFFTIIICLLLATLFAIVIMVFEPDNTKRGVMLQGAFRSNFILFGLPISTYLLNGRDMLLTTVLIAIIVPLNNILSVLAMSIFSNHKMTLRQVIHSVITNPMTIGTLIGFVIALLNIPIPNFLMQSLMGISRMITPLALIIMGAMFNFKTVHSRLKPLSITLILKLVISPVIGITAAILFGFKGELLIPMVILFSAPTAVSSYSVAISMGGDGELANQIVIFSTAFSLITMMIIIGSLNYLGFL